MNSQIPQWVIKAMAEAWHEMNVIRARDGVPYCSDGRKSDVSQEYWDGIMDRLGKAIEEASGFPPHCHPYIYDGGLYE